MKILTALIATAVTLSPAAAGAQEHQDAAGSRRVVGIVEQSQEARRVQERVRQEQERARQEQARERARSAERANQYRREYREEQTEKISRTLKIGGNGELDLSNIAGDIIVTRGGNSAQVEAVKVARGRTVEEAREMLTRVSVDFVERASRAEVKVAYPGRDEKTGHRQNINVSVQYTVTAPENTRISARSVSGNIRITDIRGDLNVVTISGNVGIFNGVRVMSAKSTSGNVEIVNLRSEIAFDAHTVSGELSVRQSKVPRMELGTISGRLIISDVDCARIEAQTLSGDIELDSSLAKDGHYELNSHSGGIRIVPSGTTGFELDANSFSGNIQSELTLKEQRQGVADYSLPSRQGGRTRSLKGIYGDGSATLDITTFSGTVVIVKK